MSYDPALVKELIAKCVGEDRESKCIMCGSHHDNDHITYDDDPSCVVSRLLQAERAGPGIYSCLACNGKLGCDVCNDSGIVGTPPGAQMKALAAKAGP